MRLSNQCHQTPAHGTVRGALSARSGRSAGDAIALWSVEVAVRRLLDDRLELVEAHGFDEMIIEARRHDPVIVFPVASTGEGNEERIVERSLIAQPLRIPDGRFRVLSPRSRSAGRTR